MKLQTGLLTMLLLFHAATAWAAGMPVSQCPDHQQEVSAGQHDMHGGMHHEQQSPAQDCCDDMNTLACQLHCAGAASCIAQMTSHPMTVNSVVLAPGQRVEQRLPPHDFSLLRPPQILS